MKLNADFSKRASVHAALLPWTPSPMPGVERRMLDRLGGEVARATTIVRYAEGSSFSAHTHGGGEEYLVLEGVFQDEHGDFPAGSYVRNPPTSHHIPRSGPGCVVFVKLWQFDLADRRQIHVDTARAPFLPTADRLGAETMALFHDENEDVRLERWVPGVTVSLAVPGGAEFLVLEGSFVEGGETFEPQSWLRLPADSKMHAQAGFSGCKVWVKTGHLANAPKAPPQAR